MKLSYSHFFQLLSDDTRLRCLALLHTEGELCVCELVHALGVIQPKISRHLATLRDAGIVADRRAGQWVYYQLRPNLADWAQQVLATTVKEAGNSRPFSNDRIKLTKMPDRPSGARCA